MSKRLLLLPLVLLLALLTAPLAGADNYTTNIVRQYGPQVRVVADASAKPPIRNPTGINAQILNTHWNWSTSSPLYIASVAPDQTQVTPDSLHAAIVGYQPKFSGVIMVINSTGYHSKAFNVPKLVANNLDALVGKSRDAHRNDVDGTLSDFIGRLAALTPKADEPVVSGSDAPSGPTDLTPLWVLLGIFAFIAAGAGLWFGASSFVRWRRGRSGERRSVKSQISEAEIAVNEIDSALVSGADVSEESIKANSYLSAAKEAFKSRDYADAEGLADAAMSMVNKANKKLHPPAATYQDWLDETVARYKDSGSAEQESETESPVTLDELDSERRNSRVRTRNPKTGRKVTIDNDNYRTRKQSGYEHYYDGGRQHGMDFNAGWYPYPFWTSGWSWSPADVILLETVLNEQERHTHYEEPSLYDSPKTVDTSYDSPRYDSNESNRGFDSGDDGRSDSGFSSSYSFSSSSDDDSSDSYTSNASSYDFGSSDNSWDFGGGSDSSSSFDSGSSDQGF